MLKPGSTTELLRPPNETNTHDSRTSQNQPRQHNTVSNTVSCCAGSILATAVHYILPFVVLLSNWFVISICAFSGGRTPESSTPTAVTRILQYFLVSDYKHSSPSLNSNQSYCYTHSLGQPSPQDGMIPFNSSTPRLVQRLFISGPTAFLVPVLSDDNCPAELVYETLVQNPPYYYEYTPYTHPISTALPSGLPFPTSHPLRPSATRPQSGASVVRTLLGLAQTQPPPPATPGVLARNSTLLRFRTAGKTLTALHSAS